MPFVWTPEAEKALLTYVIKFADLRPGTEVWDDVAQKLDGPNANACSQRFHKIKRDAEALLADTNGGAAPDTPPTKKVKTPTTKSSGKKRNKKHVDNNDEDDPIPDDSPTKSKKVKKEVKREATVVKDEDIKEASHGNTNEQAEGEDGDQA